MEVVGSHWNQYMHVYNLSLCVPPFIDALALVYCMFISVFNCLILTTCTSIYIGSFGPNIQTKYHIRTLCELKVGILYNQLYNNDHIFLMQVF